MPHAYYSVPVTAEQRTEAARLVDHSLAHHTVSNAWDRHATSRARTRELRTTGTLGEIVFADAYGLGRPQRAFGAADGQDFGQDFVLRLDGRDQRIDLKTMSRRSPRLRGDYVLNVSARQLSRPDTVTDRFFHISLSPPGAPTEALLFGSIRRSDMLRGAVGERFPAGTVRQRGNGTTFRFYEPTYEVRLDAFQAPPVPLVWARRRRLGCRRRVEPRRVELLTSAGALPQIGFPDTSYGL